MWLPCCSLCCLVLRPYAALRKTMGQAMDKESTVAAMIRKGVEAAGAWTIGSLLAHAMDANDRGGYDGIVAWYSY